MFERATRLWRDVAADRDHQAGDAPLVRADGRAVEQRLRRVLVRAVAGVDDARGDAPGEHLGRARLRVAQHDHVGRHRVQVARGVEQRLALDRRRRRARDVDGVGRQPLGGDLERRARARRRLEEQVDHRLAPQRRHLLDGALGDLQEALAEVEQRGQVLGGSGSRSPEGGGGGTGSWTTLSQHHPVRLATLFQHHAHRLRRGRLHLDARRSRAGSAARAGRGRPAPPAAPRAGARSRRARPWRRGWCGRCRARRRPG